MSDKYFYKVAENFKIPNFQIQKALHSHAGDDTIGMHYYNTTLNTTDEFLWVIPAEFRKFFTITFFKIQRDIPPHVDQNITAALNLYIKTFECKTSFYKTKSSEPIRTSKLVSQTTGYMVNIEDVKEADFFIAKPNEMWLLDSTAIHSVSCPPKGEMRSAIQIATNHFNVQEVYTMLKMSGAIHDVWLG